jgi:hypothetical protein
MAGSFAASVSRWVSETEQRIEAVRKQATQEVFEEARRPRGEGGKMRVDTGFLRNTAVASLSAMPPIDKNARPVPGQSYKDNSSAIALIIAQSKPGDTVYLGFVAAYSAERELGARGQPPDAFARSAAEQWQSIVRRVSQRAQQRAGG